MTAESASAEAHVNVTDRRSAIRNEYLPLLAVSLLICTNICLFGAYEIISSNRAEFEISFGDMLPGILVICLGISLILSGAVFFAGKRIRQAFSTVLLAAGILLWIEGGFIRWGYGEFDGGGIDWTKFSWQGWVDAAIWIIFLVVAFRFGKKIFRHVLFIALAMMLVQTGLLAARAMKFAGDHGHSPSENKTAEAQNVVPQALCQLSNSRNVFHFIMDAFQTDVFMELVAEDELSASLDGFVVYRGNLASGNQTLLSVPALFSTEVYDGSIDDSEYFRKTLEAGFHKVLFEEGYVVNLMPRLAMETDASTNYYDPPSWYAAPRRTRVLRELTYLIDVSMFRHFPHFAKRIIYNDRNWRLSAIVGDPPSHISFHHKAFFRDYIAKLETAFSKPAYHFVHLMPPHGPFVTLSDGSYAGKVLPNSWENYKNEARYMLRLFVDFLEKLRELGLYDSSIVLLHGDHGVGILPEDNATAMQKQISSVSALLLLKQAAARGPLREARSQTSLTDIPATLMDLLDIEHSYPGEAIVTLNDSQIRSRPVVFLMEKSAREPLVDRWVVEGSVYDSASWHELESLRVARRINEYDWGTRLRFGLAHEGVAYLTSGWSTTSTNYSWNDGVSAEIVFGIRPPARDVELRIAMFAYIVPGKVDRQRIRLRANGVSLGEWALEDREMSTLRTIIPREALQSDRLSLHFELPDAAVPRQIGEGRDARALAIGVCMFEASLVPENQSR